MNILIVSGFLGAGKTTFIKELSKRTQKEFVILENEYATSGVDGERLKKESNKDINIWELTEGCVCCSAKGDFAESVLTISNTLDPDYLVIEPTGVAKLFNLIENLQQIEYDRIKLLAPITIVDVWSIDRYLQEFPDIYKNQIQASDKIILSKTEELSDKELEQIIQKIHMIHADCEITNQHYTNMESDWWNDLLSKYYDGTLIPEEKQEYANVLDTFSLTNISTATIEGFIIFLENVIRNHYGNIVRAKGNIQISDCNAQFDMVDGRYSILLGAYEGQESKAIFIGNGIKKQKIRKILFQTSRYVKIVK